MKPIPAARDAWPEIEAAIDAARRSRIIRPEIALDDVPAPVRLAAHGLAINGEILDDHDNELAHGRFVLLHEPGGQSEWLGNTRVVVFVHAALEPELAVDPFLLEVGWDWLLEAIARHDAEVVAHSGTVSRSGSQSFGDIAGRPAEGAIEIRASWTVAPSQAASSVLAWCDLLATAAGLIPLGDGVQSLPRRP
ncbi:MAG: DUF3000 family protein [Candidatus Nanopelagicales bacterium]